MWTTVLFAYFFILFIKSSSGLMKCCPNGYAFGDNLNCVISTRGDDHTLFNELLTGNKTDLNNNCYRSGEGVIDLKDAESAYDLNITKMEKCVDIDHRNGTVYVKTCPPDWRERLGKCDTLFKPLFYWGASIVLFANLIYLIPYLIVVVFFIAIADLRRRAYDKAVMSYNSSQLLIALILLGMGCFILCHKPIEPVWLYIVLGLCLQFLTISSVFWLNVICFDMTLVITRFRWIPGSDVTGAEENRKYKMYSAYAWGGGLFITAITCFIELCPWIPTSSPIKPNFERFDDGANYAVILHVSSVPLITLVFNNIFFIYTTYKIIKIQKSTAVANANNNKARKKYFMFLRLYLLMDAPWVIGVSAAIFSEVWILKFCRMLQPILMLCAILPKKKMYQAMKCCPQKKKNTAKAIADGAETRC